MAIDYTLFLREACIAKNNLGVSPNDLRRDIGIKRQIINLSGYSALNGRGGSKIPISKVEDYTIGKVYRKLYERAERELSEIPEIISEDGRPISPSELEIAQDVFIAVRLAGDSGYSAIELLEEARKLHKHALTSQSR